MIDFSCPADLEPYAQAHNYGIKEQDMLSYVFWGSYGISAVAVAVERNLAGRNAKGEYAKEPVMRNFDLSEEEKRKKAIDEFVRKMEQMKAEWDRTHRKTKQKS